MPVLSSFCSVAARPAVIRRLRSRARAFSSGTGHRHRGWGHRRDREILAEGTRTGFIVLDLSALETIADSRRIFAVDRNGNAIDRDSLRERRADGRWGTDRPDTGLMLHRWSGRVQTVRSNQQLNTAVEYASLLATRTGTRT